MYILNVFISKNIKYIPIPNIIKAIIESINELIPGNAFTDISILLISFYYNLAASFTANANFLL